MDTLADYIREACLLPCLQLKLCVHFWRGCECKFSSHVPVLSDPQAQGQMQSGGSHPRHDWSADQPATAVRGYYYPNRIPRCRVIIFLECIGTWEKINCSDPFPNLLANWLAFDVCKNGWNERRLVYNQSRCWSTGCCTVTSWAAPSR